MGKKIAVIPLLLLTLVLGLPLDGLGSTPAAKERNITSGTLPQISVRIGQPRRRRWRRGGYWRDGVWYRNYGQYRRTRVGNRRYRVVPRYYWDDGRRYVRYVRVYY